MALGLALYLVSALLILPPRNLRTGAIAAVSALLALGGMMLGAKPLDPLVTDEGFYLYGYRDTSDRTILYFKEGASCNVSVVDHAGGVALSVNGKVDASSPGDMDMQLGLAYLPRFLRPEAKTLLVIGYGSGTTAGASLLFPGTRVTCCEIEPAVFAGAVHFEDVNHMPARNEKFTILFDDGRSHVQGTRETYDLILSEPSNPWMAGVSSLFTKEFYEACREKLGAKGVLAQWIQLYNLSTAEYALVVRTMLEVFPHAALLRVSDGDTILLAGSVPLVPGGAEVHAAQAMVDSIPEVRSDLEKHLGSADVRSLLLSRLLLDETGLRRAISKAADTTINTDVNLRLEFDAPLRLFHSDLNPEVDLDPTVVQAVDAPWFRRMVEGWGCGRGQVKALRTLSALLVANRKHDVSEAVLELASRLDPDDPNLMADRAIARQGDDAAEVERAFLLLLERSPEEAVRVGHDLWRAAKYRMSATLFEKMVARFPASATAWHHLAMNYERLQEWDKGEAAYQKVIDLDPANDALRNSAESFRRERALRTKKESR
jgi:spermidine synthase